MENELKVFESPEFGKVRVVSKGNEPWFILKDVCEALGIENYRNVVSRLDEDEKDVHVMDTPGGKQNMTVVNESGVYNAILRSDKPKAKDFRRWVTHEVLPVIRKHGAYMTQETIEAIADNPDLLIQLAQNLKAEREKSLQLEAKIQADAGKVQFAEAVTDSGTVILIGELAKILKGNGVDIGQNRLFEELRNRKFLISRKGTDYNMPTQKAMEMGLFRIKETVITHSDGHTTISKTPKITGRGQTYFVNLFLDKFHKKKE